jgi:hypothetical protein
VRNSGFFQLIFLGAALFSTALPAGCEKKVQTIELDLKGSKFHIEVADTPEARSRGLMFRKSLPADGGMLFVFERDQRMSFWMKNTEIPLSIAFITKDGVIRETFDMTPHSLRPVESTFTARFALEVPQGTFERLGIKPGFRLTIPKDLAESGRKGP